MKRTDALDNIQYVVFNVNKQLYSFLINEVVEILRVPEITPVSGTHEVIEGVINVRGSIIPVLNLHRRLNMPQQQSKTKKNRIVIVQGLHENIGLMVEEVKMVTAFHETDVEVATDESIEKDLCVSFAKIDGQVIGILNVYKLLYELDR